ncbi:hypothetical protein JCM8097_006297 [Rhodosporidiobolus ruineniae]
MSTARLPNPRSTSQGGTKRSATGTVKATSVAALSSVNGGADDAGKDARSDTGAEALRRALSSDEFVRRTKGTGAGANGGAAAGGEGCGGEANKRRQVQVDVVPSLPTPATSPRQSRSSSRPMSPQTGLKPKPSRGRERTQDGVLLAGGGKPKPGGVLAPRVPRTQTLPSLDGVDAVAPKPRRPSGSRSRSRCSSPLLPSASLPLPSQPSSLLPSPLLDSISASAAPSNPCPACPEPRGSTIWQPPNPSSPAITGVAVLASGELLAVDRMGGCEAVEVDLREMVEVQIDAEGEREREERWSASAFPSPMGSPRSRSGRELGGGGLRRCLSASPPTMSSLLPALTAGGPSSSAYARPPLPRGRESAPTALPSYSNGHAGSGENSRAPSHARARARGSSTTSLQSASSSYPAPAPLPPLSGTGGAPLRRTRTRTRGSHSGPSAAQTPLSSSPAERPPLQKYTSFEEQFGLSAPPSPPASPKLGAQEGGGGGGGGKWWQL